MTITRTCARRGAGPGGRGLAATTTRRTTRGARPRLRRRPRRGDEPRTRRRAPRRCGEDAVKEAVLKWTFEGDCDLMTDKFLEAQAFVGDTREERCDFFEKAFVEPQYKAATSVPRGHGDRRRPS